MILTPFKINIKKKNFLLVDIGKLGRLLLNIWFSIVVKEYVIWIELTIWVHDVNSEWIIIKTFILILKVTKWESLNLDLVLIKDLVHLLSWLSSSSQLFVVWIVFESNLLLAVITSVGHTETLYQECSGSLWTDKSWFDTKNKWINVGKLYFISTPVNTIHGYIDSKRFRRWILWVCSLKFRITDVLTTDNDFITELICESHLNLTTSSWTRWALKVLTNKF